jgi:hypothetical protein
MKSKSFPSRQSKNQMLLPFIFDCSYLSNGAERLGGRDEMEPVFNTANGGLRDSTRVESSRAAICFFTRSKSTLSFLDS